MLSGGGNPAKNDHEVSRADPDSNLSKVPFAPVAALLSLLSLLFRVHVAGGRKARGRGRGNPGNEENSSLPSLESRWF